MEESELFFLWPLSTRVRNCSTEGNENVAFVVSLLVFVIWSYFLLRGDEIPLWTNISWTRRRNQKRDDLPDVWYLIRDMRCALRDTKYMIRDSQCDGMIFLNLGRTVWCSCCCSGICPKTFAVRRKEGRQKEVSTILSLFVWYLHFW